MEAAKQIVIDKQKQTQEFFNKEASNLVTEFRRIGDLVDFYENVVRNQAGVVALQEKMISKMSNTIHAKIKETDTNEQAEDRTLEENGVDYEETETTSKGAGHDLYVLFKEPFELFGGSFKVGENHKKQVVRDRVYRFYEEKITTQTEIIDQMKREHDSLVYIN